MCFSMVDEGTEELTAVIINIRYRLAEYSVGIVSKAHDASTLDILV